MAEDLHDSGVTEAPESEAARPVAGGKRRRLLIASVVAVGVALLVVAPGMLATQGIYLERFAGLGAKYRTLATSTHRDAGCMDCHSRPGLFARAVDTVRMSGGFYVSLVMPSRAASTFPVPTNAACLACHTDLRTVSPSGDLKIPHRAHVEILKMACVQCHDFLVHEKSPEGDHNPPMAGCLTCHNGDTAKSSCPTCHTSKDAPASHKAKDWLVVHPQQAAGGKCEGCHKWAAHWCADCHSQRPASHGKDWRVKHAEAVRVHRNCEACHAGQFCIRCHGTVPTLNLDPALKLVR